MLPIIFAKRSESAPPSVPSPQKIFVYDLFQVFPFPTKAYLERMPQEEEEELYYSSVYAITSSIFSFLFFLLVWFTFN